MSLVHVGTLVVNYHAPPLLVQARADERARAELSASGAGEQPPNDPPRHFGDPSEWDEDETDDRALDLATHIASAIHDAEAIHRRNAARFDALFDLVGKRKALEFLAIARECAEAYGDLESPFFGLGL